MLTECGVVFTFVYIFLVLLEFFIMNFLLIFNKLQYSKKVILFGKNPCNIFKNLYLSVGKTFQQISNRS